MSETYDLLLPLGTVDEITVLIPGSMDGDLGHVPQWCDLVVDIKRYDDGTLKPAWPLNVRLPFRRHDGELLLEALDEQLHPNRVAAQEAIWEEMDDVVNCIQSRVEKGKDPFKRDVGRAQGLATALAYLLGVSEDEVRDQAMVRYDG